MPILHFKWYTVGVGKSFVGFDLGAFKTCLNCYPSYMEYDGTSLIVIVLGYEVVVFA